MFIKGSKEEIKYMQDQIISNTDVYSIYEVLSMPYDRLVHVYNTVMCIYDDF